MKLEIEEQKFDALVGAAYALYDLVLAVDNVRGFEAGLYIPTKFNAAKATLVAIAEEGHTFNEERNAFIKRTMGA